MNPADRQASEGESPLLDSRNYRRAIATTREFQLGREPANKNKSYPPTLLSAAEVRAMLDACETSAVGLRTRTMIVLLYRTGMEFNECLDLCCSDVNLQPRAESVSVRGGRLRDRTLALDSSAAAVVRAWVATRAAYPGDSLLCVLEGPTAGRRWYRADPQKRLSVLGREVLGRRVHPQAFRYTLAAELLIEQWPLPYIQTQLGLKGLQGFWNIFKHLGIEPPPADEVEEIARFRPAWDEGPAGP